MLIYKYLDFVNFTHYFKSKGNHAEDIAEDETPSGKSQMFIGLVIGVLGVTVLLLVVTILIMYRKNNQKIFNKHSIFKSPLSATTHHSGLTGHGAMGVGLNPTSHMLRDLQGGIVSRNSGSASTTNTASSNGGPGKVLLNNVSFYYISCY